MTIYDYSRSRSFIDRCPRSLRFTVSNLFSSEIARPIEAKFHGVCMWCGEWKFVQIFSLFSQNDIIVYGIPTEQILWFSKCFQCIFYDIFSVESYQNTRIAITHVCFNALTFAGSLRRCLNTRPAALYSNSFLGAWQMIMHEKMFDPYIDFVYRLEAGFRFHEHYEDNHRHWP